MAQPAATANKPLIFKAGAIKPVGTPPDGPKEWPELPKSPRSPAGPNGTPIEPPQPVYRPGDRPPQQRPHTPTPTPQPGARPLPRPPATVPGAPGTGTGQPPRPSIRRPLPGSGNSSTGGGQPRPDGPRPVRRPSSLNGLTSKLLSWSNAANAFATTARLALALLGAGAVAAVAVWVVRVGSLAFRANPWGLAATAVVLLVLNFSGSRTASAQNATPRQCVETRLRRLQSDSPAEQMNALRHLWLILDQGQQEMSSVLGKSLEQAAKAFPTQSAGRQSEIVRRFVAASAAYQTAIGLTVQNKEAVVRAAADLTAEIKAAHGNSRNWMSWLGYYQNCFQYFGAETAKLRLSQKSFRLGEAEIRAALARRAAGSRPDIAPGTVLPMGTTLM